ncbi:MAG TPA: hypothetical protein DDY82_03665 [Clostridiales bacterium]|nr:hypothetical protein [Clostridiales bacterium]
MEEKEKSTLNGSYNILNPSSSQLEREKFRQIFNQKIKEHLKKQEEEQKLRIEKAVGMQLPADYKNKYSDVNLSCSSAGDGLIMSLNNLGKVDIEYISALTGLELKQVIAKLQGSIFQNPDKWEECFYKGWETADEYISGNLIVKLNKCKALNEKFKGYFDKNITALENALPKDVSFDDIYVTLGSPWISTKIIEDFIRNALSIDKEIFVDRDEATGTWEIRNKSELAYNSDYTKNYVTYGTQKVNALHVIEKSLNNQMIKVTEEVVVKVGDKERKKRVVNEKETLLAGDKQKKVKEYFKYWLCKDESRKKKIETLYMQKIGSIKTRTYDGSFLTLPNLNQGVSLYPYQKNAVARILLSPNVLLAHEVGAGKTYIMIVAGMELKRTSVSQKNMYVVPNNLVDQWQRVFKSLYSKAKIFCVTPDNFVPAKRQEVLNRIKQEEFDAVIIAYSCFSLIPLSNKFLLENLNSQIYSLKSDFDKNPNKLLKENIEKLEKEKEVLLSQNSAQEGVCFDELGINTLFIDEAHNFKNVPFYTKAGNILGINPNGSKKCKDVFLKVECVQNQNDGRGVVMATGTPITNSVSDLFIIQSYLQKKELASLNISSFDSWTSTFAELVTGFEIDVDTGGYRLARRFSKFHNLPELTEILSLIADFHGTNGGELMPVFSGYTDCVIKSNERLKKYVENLSARADLVRSGLVTPKQDNMLKITTDGRKIALDCRLIDETAPFLEDSKICVCARNVYDIYKKYEKELVTQLVFCDSSTPKRSFNAYGELRRILLKMGVKSSEIAFVHEATTEIKRSELFEMVRNGKVKILIGSTWKLGMGVNVQTYLKAIHHLDVPWRPADMVQREGRILRPGNLNDKVYIYRYITEGTFDAYSWQLLETKQRFIDDLLSGSITQRNGFDVGDTVLNYAEVKALAVGNSLIKSRVETANELNRITILQKRTLELREELSAQLSALPDFIARKEIEIQACKEDEEFYKANKVNYSKEQLKKIGQHILKGLIDNEYEISERKIAVYQGFNIVLPAGMSKTDPYLIVERRNRYKMEYRITDVGIMMRLNNLLDKLPEIRKNFEAEKVKLDKKAIGLKEELDVKEDFSKKIEELKKQLKEIDLKLGVDQKNKISV